MNLKQQILKTLKPKVSAYGFNKKELQSAAAIIADNLNYEENASEEDIQNAINDKVEEYVPILKFGQSQANRIINERRVVDEPVIDDEDDNPHNQPQQDPPKKKEETKPAESPKPNEQPEWLKALTDKLSALEKTIGSVTSDIGTIKAEKTAQTRTQKMQELLKNAGAYGNSVLSTFTRLSFKDDADFDSYFEETKKNLETFDKEQKEKGIEMTPPAGGEKKEEVQELTEEQLGEIANAF